MSSNEIKEKKCQQNHKKYDSKRNKKHYNYRTKTMNTLKSTTTHARK